MKHDSIVKNITSRVLQQLKESTLVDDIENDNIAKFIGRRPKTIKARMNQIYKLVHKYRVDSRKYTDDHWEALRHYDKIIESLGGEMTYWCENGGYTDRDKETGYPMSKVYHLEITYDDGMTIGGYIKMMAAGSVEDPFSAYDTCIVLWPKSIRENRQHSGLLKEARGIKSKKLYDIMQQYGGFARSAHRSANDIHNLTDNDVLCVMDRNQLDNANRSYVGQGRYANERGLMAWAQNNGFAVKPGDEIDAMPLADYQHYVLVVVRNAHLVKGREGEGFDAWNQKNQQRTRNRYMDGQRGYIPKHQRHFSYGRMFKNPYKQGNWSRTQINQEMQDIRDYVATGDARPTNY